MTTSDEVRLNSRANEQARSVVVDECSHAGNLDQLDLVNAAILESLR